ncbi:MAG TPA: RNA 2'-phosphotransferase [Rubricoccaceae bacterium]|jgi:putative RNA 2'-phosphotransferase
MAPSLVRVSRFLSLVLRHDPGRVGLTLDEGGWVSVDDLVAASRQTGVPLDRATLEEVVAENDKRRFALSADGARIRANQGHSVPVDLGLEPLEPPATLYHGTAARAVPSILERGIHAGQRVYVHLSADEQTAEAVGRRHGQPVVLHVAAGRMHREGHPFFRSENGVWLTAAVPARYLACPDCERSGS